MKDIWVSVESDEYKKWKSKQDKLEKLLKSDPVFANTCKYEVYSKEKNIARAQTRAILAISEIFGDDIQEEFFETVSEFYFKISQLKSSVALREFVASEFP